ncbi:hypothetical protein BJ170DRAFT_480041 [Xylariales sp. AK1849]|nr:hypothetical protein BJ170DRAFT_480041 [Xylariales sp. AK1849]
MAPAVQNRGPQLFAVDVFFMTIAIITCLLRCYVRGFMVKAFGVDDWLMAFATTLFTLYSSFSIAGVHFGTGRHYADLKVDDAREAMRSWFFCYVFYASCMIASKLSIGCFLLRITVKKVHTWTVYAAMCGSVLAGLAFFLVTLLQCSPVSYFWDRVDADAPGTCVNADVIIGLGALYSAFSVISDFTFAILPAFLLWDLQLKRSTKFSIIPLLALGCIASCAVVARFPYLPMLRDPDFLFATVDIAIWSSVEQGLAITAGCLATLRPLLKVIGYRIGLTSRPTTSMNMLSNKGGPYMSNNTPSRIRNREMYKMSDFSQLDEEESIGQKGDSSKSVMGFQVRSLNSQKRDSVKNQTVCAKNESQERLSDQASKDIIVSKDFLVVSEWKSDT